MSAYHDADWAECYDLWVDALFGNEPAEDVPIFKGMLQAIVSRSVPNGEVSIVDIGTGTGRVPIALLDVMQGAEATGFKLWGTEPSAAMLGRAKRFWADAIANSKAADAARIKDYWVQCGAENFTDFVEGKTDLVIFAAGGICHVVGNEDTRKFLENIHAVLKPDGLAAISILRHYIPSIDSPFPPKPDALPEAEPARRLASKDHPGIVYVKHSSVDTQNNGIKNEKFRLDVEDEQGNILRSHELSWDARVFNEGFWKREIESAGLRVREVREGVIQVWWLLEKAKAEHR